MPALNRALALDKRHDGAVHVAEQLHLDVARPLEPAFEVHGAVAKGRHRLGPRGPQRRRQVGRRGDRAHPLAAAAGHRLEHQRVADAGGNRQDVGLGRVGRQRRRRAGHRRDAGGPGGLARRGLAAHQLDGFRRRTDEGEARVAAGRGKARRFRRGTRSRDAPRRRPSAAPRRSGGRSGGSCRPDDCRQAARPRRPCARAGPCGRSRSTPPPRPARPRGPRG